MDNDKLNEMIQMVADGEGCGTPVWVLASRLQVTQNAVFQAVEDNPNWFYLNDRPQGLPLRRRKNHCVQICSS